MKSKRAALILFVAQGMLSPLLHAAETAPSDSSTARAEAAKAFADRLAPKGSEVYVKAFKGALALSAQVQTVPAPSGARALSDQSIRRGDLDGDPRYRQNFNAMLGEAGPKIWNGQEVPTGSYPEVVLIRGSNSICSGTLISPEVVLTAAHCVLGGVNSEVIFGDSFANPRERIAVRSSTAMIQRNSPLKQGDVGILILEKPASTAPMRLASGSEIDKAAQVLAIGFGRTEDPANRPSGIKRFVELPVASSNCAGQVNTGAGPVADTAYYDCAAGTELVAGLPRLDKDTCNGDSGGPLYIKDSSGRFMLAAVVSRAVERPGFANCGDGGIYTRVDGTILAWIRSHVKLADSDVAPAATVHTAAAAPVQARTLTDSPTSAIPPVAIPENVVKFLQSTGQGAVEVEGTALVRPDGKTAYLRVRKDGQALLVPVLNPDKLSPDTNELPATFRVVAGDGGVTIVSSQLAVVARLGDIAKILSEGKLQIASQALKDYADQLSNINRRDITAEQAEIDAVSQATEAQLLEAYKKLKPDQDKLREAILRAFAELIKTNKAFYSPRDNRYKPVTYERIYRNAKGAVGIKVRNTAEVFCSGVFIGDAIVLTAGHCLSTHNPNELEVAVNYESDFSNQVLPLDVYPVKEMFARGSQSTLDYAVLLVGPNGKGKMPTEALTGHKQCLDLARVLGEEPIYVIGHPKGSPKLIADQGYVQFPFQMTQLDFDRMRLRLDAQMRDRPDREAVLKQFTESYRSEDGWLYNFSIKWKGKPTIGAIVDTFHGNSGSAAYRRTQNFVIGILVDGEPDSPSAHQPGWQRHEGILPISVIAKDLDALKPGWQKTNNVCDSGGPAA